MTPIYPCDASASLFGLHAFLGNDIGWLTYLGERLTKVKKLTEIQHYETDFFDARLRDDLARDPQFGVTRISPQDLLHSIAEDPVFF